MLCKKLMERFLGSFLVAESTDLQALEFRSKNVGWLWCLYNKGTILWPQIAYFLAPDLFTFMGQPPQTIPKGDIRGGRNFAPPQGTSVIWDVRVRRVKSGWGYFSARNLFYLVIQPSFNHLLGLDLWRMGVFLKKFDCRRLQTAGNG